MADLLVFNTVGQPNHENEYPTNMNESTENQKKAILQNLSRK